MSYSEIQQQLSQSATVRLFRSDHAALILGFFNAMFRERKLLIVSESDLIEHLAEFLEDLNLADEQDAVPEGPVRSEQNEQLSFFEKKAAQLILRWCNQGYLRNTLSPQGETLYELTPESEKALQWLDSLEKQDFVATESRLKDIVSKLRELVEQSSADPDLRIRELESRKASIDKEIARIRNEQSVRTFDDYQIKSRFLDITRQAQHLLSDFREVEANFRGLTRDIYQQHMELRGGKGQILRYAFDALNALKDSDQGKSFYAFWDFLLMTSSQQELQELTDQVHDLLQERQIGYEDSFLRHLRSYLHQAAQKVLDSNDRMAERLSRIITDTDPAESRQMKETIARIKELAVKLASTDYGPEQFFQLELNPEVQIPMERRLSLEPEEPIFLDQPDSEDLYEGDPPEALEYLFNAFFVDKSAVRERIEALLESHPEWSLKDILAQFPIQQGLPEIFAYLSLATQRDGVSSSGRTLIPFDFERQRALLMPDVRFKRD
ncbi:MAG: DUF3375 domain-containing protein [Candidatus Sericytochromatia bacterium]|nr:DUF3375 domain-containing protein [Candidatus Sericytochromatia bacterium]